MAQQQREESYRNKVLQLQQDTFELKRQSEIQSREGMVALGKTLSGIAANGDWASPESEAQFWDTVTRYPAVTHSPNFDNLAGIFERAKQARLQRDLAQQRIQREFAPGPLEKDISYYQRVLTEGDPEIIDLTRSILQSKAQKSGFSVKFGEGGTVESVDYGPQVKPGAVPGTPTTAVQTDLQKDINNTRHSLNLMGNLQKNIRAQDVGFYGVIGESVIDRIFPQFGITSPDLKRTDNRTKLRTLVQGMMRQISPDNRFTNEDRKRIEDIMPDLGVLENVTRAKQVLSELSKVFAERNVRDMQAIGAPLEMPKMSDEEIAAAARMGLIDRNVAKQFLMQNR